MSRMSQHSSTITVPIKERYEIVWSQDHQTTLRKRCSKRLRKRGKTHYNNNMKHIINGQESVILRRHDAMEEMRSIRLTSQDCFP